MTQQRSLQQPRRGASWRETALARSEIITDAWEVTKTYAGRLAEWVLFGCMVMNIIEILPGVRLWPTLSNIVLGAQIVSLDVGGFSLSSMGEQAREQGDEQAARRASHTGTMLIGIMVLTLLLVTIGLLWPVARTYTDMAEKGLILVRVVMTVIYGHVIHSLRRAGVHHQKATFAEQFTELSDRLTETEQRLTEQFTELVQRTSSERPTRTELATITEQIEAHARILTELSTLPGLLERLQQETASQGRTVVQHELRATPNAQQITSERPHRTAPNTDRPKLALVEANTEHQPVQERTPNTHRTTNDKGVFVRCCLTEAPTIRNADIRRKARAEGLDISPAYISEVRKAFEQEQTDRMPQQDTRGEACVGDE